MTNASCISTHHYEGSETRENERKDVSNVHMRFDATSLFYIKLGGEIMKGYNNREKDSQFPNFVPRFRAPYTERLRV